MENTNINFFSIVSIILLVLSLAVYSLTNDFTQIMVLLIFGYSVLISGYVFDINLKINRISEDIEVLKRKDNLIKIKRLIKK